MEHLMVLFDTLSGIFRRLFRMITLPLWSVLIGVAALCFTAFRPRKIAMRKCAEFTRIWAWGAARLAGLKISVTGEVPECGGLIVSNHTGPFDILVNASLFPVRFAPKKELKYTPFIGQVVALSRPVWIDRSRRLESGKTAAEILETVSNGVSMLVYPEGTSTDGRSGILPFKSTAFGAAESSGCPVIKLLLFFSCPDDPGKSSAWFGDTPFGTYLWHAIGLKKVEARVYIIGSTKIRETENRKTLAARVHSEMSEAYWRIMHDEEL